MKKTVLVFLFLFVSKVGFCENYKIEFRWDLKDKDISEIITLVEIKNHKSKQWIQACQSKKAELTCEAILSTNDFPKGKVIEARAKTIRGSDESPYCKTLKAFIPKNKVSKPVIFNRNKQNRFW